MSIVPLVSPTSLLKTTVYILDLPTILRVACLDLKTRFYTQFTHHDYHCTMRFYLLVPVPLIRTKMGIWMFNLFMSALMKAHICMTSTHRYVNVSGYVSAAVQCADQRLHCSWDTFFRDQSTTPCFFSFSSACRLCPILTRHWCWCVCLFTIFGKRLTQRAWELDKRAVIHKNSQHALVGFVVQNKGGPKRFLLYPHLLKSD